MASPIRNDLLSAGSIARYAAEIKASKPYPHGMFREFCDDGFMRQVREEIRANMPLTFKETDLFKMYQSMDMVNFEDDDPQMQEKIPHLLALRKSLYSEEFREFVSQVPTCLGEI
jgi:Rps23 Pro-64 3,4-dihydroxylase Tpa1-like proline 4-hydroxylase